MSWFFYQKEEDKLYCNQTWHPKQMLLQLYGNLPVPFLYGFENRRASVEGQK